MFVTIDPGEQTGFALWSFRSELLACGLGDPRSHPGHVIASVSETADFVCDVWIEWPVIYPRSKARPRDILTLARCAAEYGGMYKVHGVDVHYVEPAEWKGQLDKDISHRRAYAQLAVVEQDIVDRAGKGLPASRRHNMLDAVAIGVWVRNRR